MAKKSRKTVHVTVELDVDILASERQVRGFVEKGVNQLRSELLQGNLLATTPPVTILSYKEIA